MRGKKILAGILIGCIAVAGMSGCGKTPITDNDMAVQDKVTATENKCWDAQKPVYDGLSAETVALLEMSRNNNTAILAIVGKSPCRKVGVFEVQIAEVESKNKVLGKGVGVAGDVLMMGIGVKGAVDMVDSVADASGIKVGGDGNTVTYGQDQAKIGGSSSYVDKSGSGNSQSNIDSTFTSEKDSRNTSTVTSTPTDSNNTTSN